MDLSKQIGELITQAVAFVIFFWVMKTFAWPVLMTILDERRREISDGYAELDKKLADAQASLDEYQQRLKGIENEARTKVQEAVAEGRRVAAEIEEHARVAAAEATDRAQRNMEIELAKARVELRDDVVRMTLAASENLLRAKLDDQMQRKLVGDFLSDLENAGSQPSQN